MGISLNPFVFLVGRREPLGKTLIIGRQDMNILVEQTKLVNEYLEQHKKKFKAEDFVSLRYADKLFDLLGATSLDFMDASDYEGANVIHDLNLHVPETLHAIYDTIIDSGCIEHIYHIPNYFENVSKMLKINGSFVNMTAANNWLGHGFYQFSPELMWRFFEAYGFKVNAVDLYLRTGDRPKISSFPDPKVVKKRLQLNTPSSLVDLMSDGVKLSECHSSPILYQSDYVSAWDS